MWNQSPADLEAWYRRDPDGFAKALDAALDHPASATWLARLEADRKPSSSHNFTFAIAGSLLIALILLIPYWTSGEMELDWAVPFLAPLALVPMMAFHGWRHWKLMTLVGGLVAFVAVLYKSWEFLPEAWEVSAVLSSHPDWVEDGERINLVRQVRDLMMIHWPILLLGLTGFAYVQSKPDEERVDFVRHAVQVGILSAIVAAAGGALLGLTNLLMLTLQASSDFVEEVNIHLITWGLSGILIFGHSIWLRHPQSLERILPTVARIFIPLVVILEFGFLMAYVSKGFEALRTDREELLVFNLLLIAVIGLVMLHSAFDEKTPRITRVLVVALVAMGIVADAIGIAAIVDRLWTYGWTPNRLVVLGSNLIFFSTLVAVVIRWVRGRGGDLSPERLTRLVMNQALAVFVLWTSAVLVVLPAVYGWRLDSEHVDRFTAAAERADMEVLETEDAGSGIDGSQPLDEADPVTVDWE